MKCSSLVIWIQSVHFVKGEIKKQLVLMSLEHCLSEEKASASMSQTGFLGGLFCGWAL